MLEPIISALVEHGTTTLRTAYFYKDKIHEALAPTNVLMPRELRRVHAYVMKSPYDACDPGRNDRPAFCDQAWAAFTSLGPLAEIEGVSQHIQSRMAAKLATIDTRTQVVDMVVIECYADFQPWAGGLVYVRTANFDLVTLLRVQNCSTPATCTTVFIDDYRYEGALINTNFSHWYWLVRWLRFVGQCYNISRVGLLVLGCCAAFRNDDARLTAWGRVRAIGILFLRLPAQVIIYGSWFPVVLFVTAHAIDCPIMYLLIYRAFSTVNGDLVISWDFIYSLLTMLTCQMRNVWVLSLVTKLILLATHDQQLGQQILGFRGYVLPLVSFLSIVFDIRLLSLRNTDILSTAQALPSPSGGALVRYMQSVPFNTRYWGLYLDARSLLMAFVGLHVLLRLANVRAARHHSHVPHAVTTYCNKTMFSTSWNTMFLDHDASSPSAALVQASAPALFPRYADHVLMNVTWMTDPIEYFAHRFGLSSPFVHIYYNRTTQREFCHPWGPQDLRASDASVADAVEHVRSDRLMNIPWRQRIYTC
ncbi:hypothetical protein ACHHYP_08021 [Achlya hypogyna]|uniref:Uncharacterized protein n=1 Tax=Achlya hypogyna TaxID=1202772 RepID=A0A1V9YQ17_ACHHY|nr:hypothetical protein ACHHYP_08021 [Achlya hypogyna]